MSKRDLKAEYEAMLERGHIPLVYWSPDHNRWYVTGAGGIVPEPVAAYCLAMAQLRALYQYAPHNHYMNWMGEDGDFGNPDGVFPVYLAAFSEPKNENDADEIAKRDAEINRLRDKLFAVARCPQCISTDEKLSKYFKDWDGKDLSQAELDFVIASLLHTRKPQDLVANARLAHSCVMLEREQAKAQKGEEAKA